MNERDVIRQLMLPTFDDKIGERQMAFEYFHADHPEVYTELRRRARMMQERGMRFGLRTIYEAMRWDFAMTDQPKPYKLNNNHASFYARLLMEQEPDLAAVFEIRGTDV